MDNVIYNVSADIICWPLVANCESLTGKKVHYLLIVMYLRRENPIVCI